MADAMVYDLGRTMDDEKAWMLAKMVKMMAVAKDFEMVVTLVVAKVVVTVYTKAG